MNQRLEQPFVAPDQEPAIDGLPGRLEIAKAREARVEARRVAREAEAARQRAEREAEFARQRAEEEAREAERRANLRKRPGLASVLASHQAAKAARKDRH
ncbi:hypothetical protein [Teichococcus vastitatis]|uniref:Uncharacterized protein n=1 Tax=Teichococcus vastitatis TaxID=2307076 RepID=A0ABS9W890_9PROT|nr:hypothetical protein [Pseudoroseomonas vastitatis]MCI0754995.1 hypothetical protein [Pseudoroseomonas vastitatis]